MNSKRMNPNPIVERQREAEEEHRRQESFRYPFKICCVFLPEDGTDFPIFYEVKQYCEKNHLTFYSREYSYGKYEEDLFVKRTLAFHIYYKGYIQETHYYDTDPIHKIQLVVWAYQDVEKEKARKKQERKEKWNTFVEGFQSIFTMDHFKRKPALDKDSSLSHSKPTA